jgi:hypothetical protein
MWLGLLAHAREPHLAKHPRLLLERQRVPVPLRVALPLRPTLRPVLRYRRQSTSTMRPFFAIRASKEWRG